MAPRGLAPSVQSLPPILYATYRQPMPSCSKGSRGLSVLPRVSRIFTTSAISPGPWSRQRPNRCAFRAGRNLPDKEFRYLRTVIVTAAVYRGLDSPLRHKLTAPRDLPAPGRRQTLYVALRLQQSPVFLVNSRLDQFSAAPPGSGSWSLHPLGRPFSRSYGAILPSSLTMVLPIASVCSTHPPVSVCGTGPSGLPRGFSRQRGITGFAQRLRPRPQAHGTGVSLGPALRRIAGTSRTPSGYPPASPHRSSARRGCRNVHRLCIGYACRPRLSSRLTRGRLASPRKPWVCGGGVSLTALVTHASILTPGRSTRGRPHASPRTGSSPTDQEILPGPAASAPCLAPCIVGACPLDQ